MRALVAIFELATGRVLAPEEGTPARRAQLAVLASAASLVMASLWGIAAGSTEPMLALQNALKLPLMLVLAGISAVPIGLLCWKLVGVGERARELLHAYALSVFLGCSVLLVLAPLVALYYFSSNVGGPLIALGSIFLSLAVGCLTFVRVVRARLGVAAEFRKPHPGWRPLLPGVALALAFAASLAQITALFAPILPERTPFRGGIDDVLDVR